MRLKFPDCFVSTFSGKSLHNDSRAASMVSNSGSRCKLGLIIIVAAAIDGQHRDY